jgi:hypothetical protein
MTVCQLLQSFGRNCIEQSRVQPELRVSSGEALVCTVNAPISESKDSAAKPCQQRVQTGGTDQLFQPSLITLLLMMSLVPALTAVPGSTVREIRLHRSRD